MSQYAMAATRRAAPLQIFQDPVTSFDHHEVADTEARLLNALAPPITDVSSEHHTLLNPPVSNPGGHSPLKTSRQSSSPPPSALAETNLNSISIPPPFQQQFFTDSPMKRVNLTSGTLHGTAGKQQMPLFTAFATSSTSFDKENLFPLSATSTSSKDHLTHGPESSSFASTIAHSSIKTPLKPALMEPASLKEKSTNSRKRKIRDEDNGIIPEPDQMPTVEDDGAKPPYSYAQLIGMAILRAPNRRLTLAQIYKWISDTFKFYRSPEMGWQNSIRHNLSLNKNFVKQERPKDDPGKGHYWTIDPGHESQFVNHKPRRSTNPDSFLLSVPAEMPRPAALAPPVDPSSTHHAKHMKSIDSSKFPQETELSSDATIPCSDPAIHDGEELSAMAPPARLIPSSPPPADIRSSPPPPLARSLRQGTPPRVPRFPSNSRSGGRKRKFAGFGDSGYYSSIESSATKGLALGPMLLTSEADMDRPSMKPGRAEQEIARIRSSSYDSPTKTRTSLNAPSNPAFSSPFRQVIDSRPDGPLTPAVVFKKPARPPASVSPNTNLRIHRNRIRELLGSPDKNLNVFAQDYGDSFEWGPDPTIEVHGTENFSLHEDGFHDAFDVFTNRSPVLSERGSPEKRFSKRPRLERAATTAGVLADITGMNGIARPQPSASDIILKPYLRSPARFESPAKSPCKAPTSNPSPMLPIDTPPFLKDDMFGVDLHSDESEEGLDILQGFQKIGAAAISTGSPSKPPSRPAFGRSSTSLF